MKIRAGAKKRVLLSQLSRRTRVETLTTKATRVRTRLFERSLFKNKKLSKIYRKRCRVPVVKKSPRRKGKKTSRALTLMSRIDLVSKILLANCIRNFSKKNLKKTIQEIANFANIAKVTGIFLAK